jgi:hypothetical protein
MRDLGRPRRAACKPAALDAAPVRAKDLGVTLVVTPGIIMLFNCYLRNRIVYIPVVVEVQTGGHREIEPVAVVSVSDTEKLRGALREGIVRGNRVVPSLRRADYPPPIMPKYAGLKSLASFACGTSLWSIKETGGDYRIVGYQKPPNRGWREDPDQTITLPSGSGVEDVADRLIAIPQKAARQ